MSVFTAIDLTKIAPPDVVEVIDFETIFAEMLADLRERDPVFTAITESDPAYVILEVAAYRETQLRQKINDDARAVMLPTATNADLDNLGAFYNTERLLIDVGDQDAIPPIDPVYESDDAFRSRIQLAPEGLTAAGTKGAYRYWSLSASGQVKDVDVSRPVDGVVQVAVLAHSETGQPDQATMDAVDNMLQEEDVRPLCDTVRVISSLINNYTITAELILYPGPDSAVVLQAAQEAVQQYADDNHRCGFDITRSGIFAALHQPGVQNVNLISPANDLVHTGEQTGYCTAINLSITGVDQ